MVMLSLFFNNRAPFTIKRMPDTMPVTRIQIPMVSVPAPVLFMVLYAFSSYDPSNMK